MTLQMCEHKLYNILLKLHAYITAMIDDGSVLLCSMPNKQIQRCIKMLFKTIFIIFICELRNFTKQKVCHIENEHKYRLDHFADCK